MSDVVFPLCLSILKQLHMTSYMYWHTWGTNDEGYSHDILLECLSCIITYRHYQSLYHFEDMSSEHLHSYKWTYLEVKFGHIKQP